MQPIRLDMDFECANAVLLESPGGNAFSVATRPDRAVDNEQYAMADYYLAVRLHNPNPEPDTARLTYRELEYPASGRTLAVWPLFGARAPRVDEWFPLDPERLDIDAAASSCAVELTVPAGCALDVSSMYWLSASQAYRQLERHADRVCVQSLGATAQDRSIPLVTLSAQEGAAAPLAVVAATPQCHELGTIAVMGLLESALNGALDEVLSRFRLAFLPLTNPDGNALGHCMTNALRQNVVFGFGAAGTGRAAAECEAVWDYLSAARPSFFLEYHSYPHLNRPSFRPYDLDRAFFPDAASRTRGERFFAALASCSPNPPVQVRAGSRIAEQFRPSLISRLVQELGVPATLYKLHNRETIAANLGQAHQVLVTAARALAA
jgi:hypothetical protein